MALSRYLREEEDAPGGQLPDTLGSARAQLLYEGPLGCGLRLCEIYDRYKRNRTAIQEWFHRPLVSDAWKDSDNKLGEDIVAITKPRREEPQKWKMLDPQAYMQEEETDDTEKQEEAKPKMANPTPGSPYYWPTTYLHVRIGTRTFENVALQAPFVLQAYDTEAIEKRQQSNDWQTGVTAAGWGLGGSWEGGAAQQGKLGDWCAASGWQSGTDWRVTSSWHGGGGW